MDKYESVPFHEIDRNIFNIPVNWIDATEEGMAEFNKIYQAIKDAKIRTYVKTASGGLNKRQHLFRIPCYNINITKSSIELVYIGIKCYKWRFRSSYKDDEGNGISGKLAYNIFRRMVEELGGNLADLAIDNGEEVKWTIPDYKRDYDESIKDMIITDAYHIDINSAFMAGIRNYIRDLPSTPTTEAVVKTIEHLYEHRKDGTNESRYYKDILTHTYGYFQSLYCTLNGNHYALAHLSKAAVEFTNKVLEDWDKRIIASGGRILAHNTDGIWFTTPNINSEALRSLQSHKKGLGDMKLDVHAKSLRFKSTGSYEYIDENDKYVPKVQGLTRRDSITPRSEWKWGDIYQEDCVVKRYKFDTKLGIVPKE